MQCLQPPCTLAYWTTFSHSNLESFGCASETDLRQPSERFPLDSPHSRALSFRMYAPLLAASAAVFPDVVLRRPIGTLSDPTRQAVSFLRSLGRSASSQVAFPLRHRHLFASRASRVAASSLATVVDRRLCNGCGLVSSYAHRYVPFLERDQMGLKRTYRMERQPW